jgi:hypothetical protein
MHPGMHMANRICQPRPVNKTHCVVPRIVETGKRSFKLGKVSKFFMLDQQPKVSQWLLSIGMTGAKFMQHFAMNRQEKCDHPIKPRGFPVKADAPHANSTGIFCMRTDGKVPKYQ